MARKLRQALPVVLPALGVALILGAVVFGESVAVKVTLVVAGLLLTEAGVWRLADPVLPDDRTYMALRAEADRFMVMVRQLNTAALALDRGDDEGPRFAIEELQSEMHRAIDRMVTYAGKTREEMEAPGHAAVARGDTASEGRGAGPGRRAGEGE